MENTKEISEAVVKKYKYELGTSPENEYFDTLASVISSSLDEISREHKSYVSLIQSEVGSLESEVSSLEWNIDDLKTKLSALKKEYELEREIVENLNLHIRNNAPKNDK
jgi:peptidoglycan hydrolase CwlO-like protein